MKTITRRRAMLLGLAAPLLPLASGCRASLPQESTRNSREAAFSLLNECAAAHGLSAYSAINDLNVGYAGDWHRLAGILQPILVDSGFRGGSQERLLLHDGIIAQMHSGPKGLKKVVRFDEAGGKSSIRVWFNGEEAQDRDRKDAAALVAEAYSLFLLGPLLLVVNENPRRDLQAFLAGTAGVRQEKRTHLCDVLSLRVSPGFGNSDADQLALYIDRQTRLLRKIRMTINGLESTRGALIDVDTFEHRSLHGIMWPIAFHERLLRPAPLDVHEWRLTGLDINRGESLADFGGPAFSDRASAPAAALPPAGHS